MENGKGKREKDQTNFAAAGRSLIRFRGKAPSPWGSSVKDVHFFAAGRFLSHLWKTAIMTVLVFAMCLTSACGIKPATALIVAGSTSVQPYAEILAEEFARIHPGSEIDVQGGGSSAGITAAGTGTTDIGMSSRHLKEEERTLLAVEIARDGLAIIAHPDNPVGDLTLAQVRDIYTAKTVNWSGLKGKKAEIHIVAREEGSGTRSAFEELVMGEDRIVPEAIVLPSYGAIREFVSRDPNAIGFISLGLVDHQQGLKPVKALRLDGVAPTRENIENGSYSLFRPFLFVMKGEPAGLARQFIDFTLSEEGQQILIKEGLFP